MRESQPERTVRTRPAVRLNAKLDKSLFAYAAAAIAAGVGLLALAQPGEGKVIYTKAHKQIASNTTLHLDLNHDGVTDFNLKNFFSATGTPGTAFGSLTVSPAAHGNAIWGHSAFRRGYASALYAGIRVGPKGRFLPGAGKMASADSRNYICTGGWANVANRYLGLKFFIKGQAHFGWARLNVTCSGGMVNPVLTGYAYETVADRPILTGRERGSDESNDSTSAASSGSLGRLAQGAGTRQGR
jgi:hypothetical protein